MMEHKDDNRYSSFTSIYVEGSPLLITKQSNYMRIDSSASKLSSHSNDDGSSRNTTPQYVRFVYTPFIPNNVFIELLQSFGFSNCSIISENKCRSY